jgi:tetratricopeptide (TPR) repeat protein
MLDRLRTAYQADPANRDTGANLAQWYTDLGWFNEAIGIYRELVERHPGDYSLLLDYGNILFKRLNCNEALAIFRKLTVMKPDRLEGWNNLGIIQLTLEKYADAKLSFGRVLELEPDNCGALLNIGNVYDRKGEVEKAVTMFEKATTVRRDFPDAWFNLGNAYVKTGSFEKAVTAYQRALKVQREFPSARKNLGYCFEQLQDFAQAEEQYSLALEINKADAGLYVNIANVYIRQEKFDSAKSYYLRAVKLAPKDPAGWMGLRRLSLLKGDITLYLQATLALLQRLDGAQIAESISTLRTMGNFAHVDRIIHAAEGLAPDNEELNAERLLAYLRSGPIGGRETAIYRRLSALQTPGDTIRYSLATYALETGDLDKAHAIIAAVKEPGLPHRLLQWRIAIGRSEWSNAESQIRGYLADHEDCFEGWFLLARAMAAQGRKDYARISLLKALETGFVDQAQIAADSALNAIFHELTTPSVS